MVIDEQSRALHVVGIELRTNNAEAMRTIPSFWQRFVTEGGLDRWPDRVSDDVYAVYGHFEHAGLNNTGCYSLVIGAEWPVDRPVPPGLVRFVVPAGRCAVFPVASGGPEQVVAAWREVWARDDLPKRYIADVEHYRPDGRIEIRVGLHQAASDSVARTVGSDR